VVTPILKRMEPQRPILAGLVALLILTFGVIVFLSWAALKFRRDAQHQAHETVRGWAQSAGDHFSGLLQTYANNVAAGVWFGPLVRSPLPSTMLPVDTLPLLLSDMSRGCPCTTPNRVRYYFSVDFRTGALDAAPSPPAPAVQDWIRRTILSASPASANASKSKHVSVVVAHVEDEHRMLGYFLLTEPEGDPIAAYGWDMDAVAVGEFVDLIWNQAALLPHITKANTVNDSLLSVVVTDASGAVVYRSPVQYDTAFSAIAVTDAPLPGLELRVSVRPDRANVLVPGGIPGSPHVLLFAMLTISVLLLFSALFLIRRESELARLRADFIAGVSHELRTPLAQIRMFAETLLLGRVRNDAERVRSLEVIDQEARRLAHLVENVLIFAKSERRRSRINPELTDLPADAREAIQSFAVLCRSRDIEVRPELQDNISAPADRGALRQILLNLLDNAVKYGPLRQRITVGMALFDSNVRIWVDDEGPGIPPDEREHVFGRFVRLSRDAESAMGGSGIGLAIVRELVLLHGGRVWIDDSPSGGTRVVFELPGAYVRPDSEAGGWAVA
jgi:signal transduction histidine kinase